MSERKEVMLSVAKATKDALYAQWDQKKYFDDFNNFYEVGQGLLSEAMGLTSVMLLYVRFAEDTAVYSDGLNDAKTVEIIKSSLNFIYKAVVQDGYLVTPLRTKEETSGVIDRDNGYVDTITWVLSSSTLLIYAVRQGLLTLDEADEKKAIELIADSAAWLVNAQLENGAWGFSSGKGCKPSMYSTYAAVTAMADFLDYVLGELVYYENEENQKKDPQDFYDWQTVNAINNYYKDNPKPIYPTKDIVEVIAQAKAKVQLWLLKYALPSLPKLAACVPLNAEERVRLGIPEQTPPKTIKLLGDKDYINLYYAFYMVDILTTSSADKRYQAIVEGDDSVSLEELSAVYADNLNSADREYYFANSGGEKARHLLGDYVDQAIHAARMNFSIAQRTGKDFWEANSNASELLIQWEHEALPYQRIANARGDVEFTEPTLVPMALRANTVYCYYIIDRADITVDNLFDVICEDRSPATERVKREYRVKDLWDRKNYSLPITERAIEALVDYYDYLEKYDTAEQVARTKAATSIDQAVDEKIREYLMSEQGRELLGSLGYCSESEANPSTVLDETAVERLVEKKACAILEKKLPAMIDSKLQATAVSSESIFSALDVDAVISVIESLQSHLINNPSLPREGSPDDRERLAYALLHLYALLGEKTILNLVDNHEDDPDKAAKLTKRISGQMDELIGEMVAFMDKPWGSVAKIYSHIATMGMGNN